MTNAKHTPQWYISTCPETGRRFLCEYGVDNNIAELFGTSPQNNLITATPELLEALKTMVNDWGADWPFKYVGFEIGPNHAITKARAAIAKAEGK